MESGESKFYEIVGRALTDIKFQQQLIDHNSRAAALEPYDIVVDETVHKALDEAISSINALFGAFDGPRVAS